MTAGRTQDGTQEPGEWQRAARAFPSGVDLGRLDVPLPGSGATWRRWAAFADLAEEDLSLARLGEGHADAVAILAELGGPGPCPGSRWGVWAASPPGPGVTAGRPSRGWAAVRRAHGAARAPAGHLAGDRDGGQRHARRRLSRRRRRARRGTRRVHR